MERYPLTSEESKEMRGQTEDAISRGINSAHEEWREMAIECLRIVASKNPTFTVNQVRELVDMSPLKTHDNRAMGGVIRAGLANKWIEKTGDSIPSVVGHKVHIQIWRSKIYKDKATLF